MNRVDEGFFKSAYERYAGKVIAYLKKMGINAIATNERIASWIDDFFSDGYDALDCAQAIRDNYTNESVIYNTSKTLNEEVNMNLEDELFIAKKTAERAGYKVIMPSQRSQIDDNRARIDAAKARLGARPAAPTVADNLEKLAVAARTAERAGYTIRKAGTQAPAAKPAPTADAPAKKEDMPTWVYRAANNFMPSEEK